MATYKVIQDIEAEDKLIGWMTPRQAIYAAIVIVSGAIWFMLANSGFWWLGLIFLPHMVLFIVLAGPFVHDQPSEVWLLAKIKFMLVPRRRIWDQSGLKEVVTVTAPKKVERILTDGLTQTEVKSRLQALANTIDSRGWAIKNVDTNVYGQASVSDRLVAQPAFIQEVPNFDIYATDDVLDARNNPIARQMQQMVGQYSQVHRQQAESQLQPKTKREPTGPWFVNPSTGSELPPEEAEKQAIRKSKSHKTHVKETKKSTHKTEHKTKNNQITDPDTDVAQPPIDPTLAAQLAQNNDLYISTIQRQANQADKPKDDDNNEVVVPLR